MAKVLLMGYIPEFLQERERILRAAGYEVTMVASFAAASTAADQEIFDVAVLGFSVPEEERNHLAGVIKQKAPATSILMVYFTNIKNAELADALIPTTATSEDMLRAVNHILNNKDKRTG